MSAMDSSSRNAGEMLDRLTLTYNRSLMLSPLINNTWKMDVCFALIGKISLFYLFVFQMANLVHLSGLEYLTFSKRWFNYNGFVAKRPIFVILHVMVLVLSKTLFVLVYCLHD